MAMATEAEVVPVLTTRPVAVATTPEIDEDYIREAKKLGVKIPVKHDPSSLDNALRRLFQMEEIMIYPFSHVMDFLRKLAAGKNTSYRTHDVVWKPLRSKDWKQYKKIADALPSEEQVRNQVQFSDEVYSLPVPIEALKVANTIDKGLGWSGRKSVSMFVSDYEARVPDPFLMVKGPTTQPYVVFHWDEPEFKITTKAKRRQEDSTDA